MLLRFPFEKEPILARQLIGEVQVKAVVALLAQDAVILSGAPAGRGVVGPVLAWARGTMFSKRSSKLPRCVIPDQPSAKHKRLEARIEASSR